MNLFGYVDQNPVNKIDPMGLWGAGVGLYAPVGAEVQVNVKKCCIGKTLYRFLVLTTCGGAGLAFKVPLSRGGGTVNISDISSDSGCPRNRTYFRHDVSLAVRTAGVDVNFTGGGPRMAAGVDFGLQGGGVTWKICGDSILDVKPIGQCCN